MSWNRQNGICLIPSSQREGENPSSGKTDQETERFISSTGCNDEEVLEITVDLVDDREVLKTAYEIFHREIGQIPLLSREEEQELSRRIQEEGDHEAYQRFILGNLRLVIACAKKVKDRMGEQSILSFMDMVQEGMIGLSTAVRRFDYRKKTRFSTYGIPWIYQRIKMVMVQQRYGFTVPGYAGTSVYNLSDHIRAFKSGDLDSIPEDIDIDRIKALARISGVTLSIDYPEENGKAGSSVNPEKIMAGPEGNLNSSPAEDWVEENLEEGIFREEVLHMFRDHLSPKEFSVICMRFGLGGQECHTLSDIAEVYGKSSEHIRSVVNRSMEKLKKEPVIREFCLSWDVF
jgi:RNA polymerase primary sigma factor